jgi:hypothetical protein
MAYRVVDLAIPLAIALGVIAACATRDYVEPTPKPGSRVREYRQLASQSILAVLDALRSLEQVSAQGDQCAPKLVNAFAEQVEQLQVKSLRVRARAQAIQARGDAYFEAWAKPGNDGQSSQPPEHFPELRESFTNTKVASQQAGDAFRSFLSGLRALRGDLLADSAALKTDKAKDLVRTTREHGLNVLQKLGVLTDELQVLGRLLERNEPNSSV